MLVSNDEAKSGIFIAHFSELVYIYDKELLEMQILLNGY